MQVATFRDRSGVITKVSGSKSVAQFRNSPAWTEILEVVEESAKDSTKKTPVKKASTG